MENIEIAKSAENGVSDISGVKIESVLLPEQNKDNARFDAESANPSKLSDSAEESKEASDFSNAENSEADRRSSVFPDGDNTEENESEEELEKLFDAMVSGKFRNAYRKRTESIVRKRLRSGKARPDTKDTPKYEEATAESVTGKPQNSVSDKEIFRENLSRNRARPTENGCGGSIGVVSKINVSALNGNDVRAILRRALAGEKITFK